MTRRIQLSQTAPAPNLPAPGDVLGGKYRVDRMLGVGGMGAVFEATHCLTNKQFAIKWLLTHPAEGSDLVRRFVREAQLAGRIKHPNVVEIYDVYQEPAAVFLVMELLDGESLAARLARLGPLSTPEALACMMGSLEGIAAAHAAGIIHRDIKPANIFLCTPRVGSTPLPKVLDFGVSRLEPSEGLGPELTTTRSGTVMGTPHYMAPEQMRGGDIDARADVYAVGVTLYEVLSGVTPYAAENYPDLILKVIGGKAVPLHVLRPSVSPELAAVVQRAMSVDPAQRYATIEALMEALAQASRAVPAVPTQRPRRWIWAAVAGLCIVLLLWLGLARRPAGVAHEVKPTSSPREHALESNAEKLPVGVAAPVVDPPPSAADVPAGPGTVESSAPRPKQASAPKPKAPPKPVAVKAEVPVNVAPAPIDETPRARAPEPQPTERKTSNDRPTISFDRKQF